MEKRRQFLKVMLGFLGGVGVVFSPLLSMIGSVYAKTKKIIVPKGTKRESLINENPAQLDTRNLEITPLGDFGTMGLADYGVNLKSWRLEVGGRVKKPLRLKHSELLALPFIERAVLLICPGFFANNGRWKGLSVNELLGAAEAEKGITRVTFAGPEGEYEKTETFPLEDILSNQVFLAYEVNGKALPKPHGFPLRVVAEDFYGARWVKYVHRITVA